MPAPCHSLQAMSGPPSYSYSFSDPAAGWHCFGLDGGPVLVLDGGGARSHAGAEPVQAEPDGGRWELSLAGSFAAVLEALGPPIVFAAGARREWLCRLSGSARAGGEDIALRGFGRVALGPVDLDGLVLRRAVWGCFGEELAFALSAERPRNARGHGDERLEAFVARGAPLGASAVHEPRLSSTFGPDGALLRAGFEFWESDEDEGRPLRIAGESVALGELETIGDGAGDGQRALVSVAFLVCHHARATGLGGYEIVRAAG
jgi:hypothetical protein